MSETKRAGACNHGCKVMKKGFLYLIKADSIAINSKTEGLFKKSLVRKKPFLSAFWEFFFDSGVFLSSNIYKSRQRKAIDKHGEPE